LQYWSFDTISEFVYGPDYGATKALLGSKKSQHLIDDLLDPARRRLAWAIVHFPAMTKWLTTRTGHLEKLLNRLGLMPMTKPFVYSGIRAHALESFHRFKAAPDEYKVAAIKTTLVGRLFEVREKHKLSDVDIASECADHLLAGIDTTADTLMFMIWALSLPKHNRCQKKLRREVSSVEVNDDGLPAPKDLMQLPYLNAVIRETLRLYAPIPTYEPRSIPVDTVIDGFVIPANTIVGMSPYCLHRNEAIYPKPLSFQPERWLDPSGALLPESHERNRNFWAFSSGARMCIGIHLANAEMLSMTAALYRKFSTTTDQINTSPAITSRYEVFGDETTRDMIEHECWIHFNALEQ
jgi:cytochrome P450